MAFQYASYAIPQAPQSSLAALFEGLQQGQNRRRDENAYEAAAGLGTASQPTQPMNLAALAQQPAANPSLPDPNVVVASPARPALQSAVNAAASRAVRNNNPGNLIASPWTQSQPGYSGSDGRFAIFANPQAGQAAQTALLNNYVAKGTNTIASIVNKWAPSSDGNPVNAYVSYVAQRTGIDPNAPVSGDALPAIAQAMGEFESGNRQSGTVAAPASMPAASGAAAAGPAPGVTIPGQVPLPDRDTLLALLRSPDTRGLAVGMIQAYRNSLDPSNALKDRLTLAQIGEANARAGAAGATKAPAAVQEYQYAVGQGYKGSFADFQKELKKAGATSIDFNQNQGIAAGFADRMANSDRILNDPQIVSAMTDPANGAKASLPGVGNYLVGPKYQMAEQAKRDFVNAILRRESGAAISPSEFDNADRQYFPQPGDSPEVIRQKAQNRQIALQGVQRSAGPNYQGPSLDGAGSTILTYNPETGELE